MQNRLLPPLIALSLALSPVVRADAPASSNATEVESPGISLDTPPQEPTSTEEVSPQPELGDTLTSPSDTTEQQESEGTDVTQGSNERQRAAKRRQLRNIAIAAGAVIVAVVAMILVSTNNGHKK